MKLSRTFILGSVENVIITFITSFIGYLTLSGSMPGLNVSDLKSAGAAGLTAAMTVVYSVFAGLKTGTASLVAPAAVVTPVAQDDVVTAPAS